MLVEALVRRRSAESASPLRDLTPREIDVLREMAQGKSNAAVAAALSLSESSIEKYTNVIFSKLGLAEEPALHRRVAAVIAFLREQGDIRQRGRWMPGTLLVAQMWQLADYGTEREPGSVTRVGSCSLRARQTTVAFPSGKN